MQTIQASTEAANQAAREVLSGVNDYTSFNIKILFQDIPVDGSILHDDEIFHTIREALDTWKRLMENDERNIISLNDRLQEADLQISKRINSSLLKSPINIHPDYSLQNHFLYRQSK